DSLQASQSGGAIARSRARPVRAAPRRVGAARRTMKRTQPDGEQQGPWRREERHDGEPYLTYGSPGGRRRGESRGTTARAELGSGTELEAAAAAEFLLRDERRSALRAELPPGLLCAAFAADRLRAAGRERRRRCLGRETAGHGVADAHADRHLRADPREAAPDPVLGHALACSNHGLPGRVRLIAPRELLHVPGVLAELLIEPELLGLRIGGGARDADLPDAHLALGLRDLGVRGDEAL